MGEARSGQLTDSYGQTVSPLSGEDIVAGAGVGNRALV